MCWDPSARRSGTHCYSPLRTPRDSRHLLVGLRAAGDPAEQMTEQWAPLASSPPDASPATRSAPAAASEPGSSSGRSWGDWAAGRPVQLAGPAGRLSAPIAGRPADGPAGRRGPHRPGRNRVEPCSRRPATGDTLPRLTGADRLHTSTRFESVGTENACNSCNFCYPLLAKRAGQKPVFFIEKTAIRWRFPTNS